MEQGPEYHNPSEEELEHMKVDPAGFEEEQPVVRGQQFKVDKEPHEQKQEQLQSEIAQLDKDINDAKFTNPDTERLSELTMEKQSKEKELKDISLFL